MRHDDPDNGTRASSGVEWHWVDHAAKPWKSGVCLISAEHGQTVLPSDLASCSIVHQSGFTMVNTEGMLDPLIVSEAQAVNVVQELGTSYGGVSVLCHLHHVMVYTNTVIPLAVHAYAPFVQKRQLKLTIIVTIIVTS